MKIKLIICIVSFFFHSIVKSNNDTLVFLGNDIISPKNLKTYIQAEGLIDIQTILKSDSLFHKTKEAIPNFGVSTNENWLTFTLKNESLNEHLQFEIEYPTLDKVYFIKTINASIESFDSAGESFPFITRKNDLRNIVFDLNLKPTEIATYFIKVESGDQIILPITISDKTIVSQKNARNNMFAGLYFGIILVMVLYNIFIYLSIRDRSYLFYVLYILLVGLTQSVLNGYAFKYFWPNIPWLAERATQFSGASVGIITIFFVRNFLQTKQYAPRFNFLLTIFAYIYVISFVLTLFGQLQLGYNLININAGPGSFILLFTGIYIYWKHKNRPALFFTVAWSIFLVSVIVFVLKDVGLIPYNSFTVYGLQIGSAIEVTLLSFALADKINIYRAEKEQSQSEALLVAQENERIIREQNITLELNVTERTKELNKTNSELNKTLDNLKETQSQLVESEKMASLGQLTAGIAHEINNPINFVTSNVKPLKRDVDILLELITKIEEIASTGIEAAEKEKQIAELKLQYDFDYLKEEITFLLKGINEGSIRTAEIVKGLRIFSRVDEDDLKKADINEGIDSTLIIMNNQLNGRININKKYGNIPLIECYPGKLNQVFLNLISNSIYAINAQYNTQNGGEITITTSTNDLNVQIIFADNGIGMTESTLKKLFEPFYTTKPVGEGTGLGLSISYNTIKKHHGTISVVSKINEGTTFMIEIPLINPNS
jgi:signal transduction histidine kinase